MKTNIIEPISEFLETSEEEVLIMLKRGIEFALYIRALMKTYHLDEEDICKRFKIKSEEFKSFISGTYEYTLQHISAILCPERRSLSKGIALLK